MSAHTPGPWSIYTGMDADYHEREGWVLVMAGGNAGRIVANVNVKSCPDVDSAPAFVGMPANANARLIAAAPDLLKALDRIAETAQFDADGDSIARGDALIAIARIARDVLSKAKGTK